MNSLEAELDHARELSVGDLADAIETIGFECTHCGACCKATDCDDDSAEDGGAVIEEHTATVFPDEVREIQAREEYDWRDVARPMPYGLDEDGNGDTFEWALQTDGCGDCTFYDEEAARCGIYGDRPLICRTYPFSVDLGAAEPSARPREDDASEGTSDGALSQPMGKTVDSEGAVRAHECEGLGRDISREDAEALAEALKERAVRELEEAVAVRDNYEPVDSEDVVVHDSEGTKHADGTSF